MTFRPQPQHPALLVLASLPFLLAPSSVQPADPPGLKLFDRPNLVAWCIVPFDAKKRSPEERAAMLKRLGFRRYAYDWRAEHLPTFEREVAALNENGVELTAVWFPADLGPDAQKLLAVLKKHKLKPQLWVTMGDPGGRTQQEKVQAAAKVLRPVAEEAGKLGSSVALYNHGSWFGEPDNQLAILDALKMPNVGIVYNLHHGHDHLDRFPELLRKVKPHLLALNLNGMVKGGDRGGKKILPLGQGEEDLRLLRTIAESGWRGPVGILGHTDDDAEERLRDNLDGLDWLVPQLKGEPAGPRPTPRTLKKSSAPPNPSGALVPPPGPNLAPADARIEATLIDRSADDAYMAVRADGAGRVFVGGREKVFVFEPDGKGGFHPRRELLRFPPDSIIIGLEYRGGDLYVLASHGLYLVPGGRLRREGLTPKRILWGVPLDYHVSFHCLTWGPDGALYLDHGDPLLNYGDWSRPDHWGCWTLYAGPDRAKVPYTGAGAVLKVRPDGGDPRVLARGLRGPVGLTFDCHWNLFTDDNDHESRADLYAPMRLLHVGPQADFAWPRGWMASKSPDRADLLDSLHPALGRGVPCDLAFYDEPALPNLRGSLLLCRWDRYAVTRHRLRPKGAGFAADDEVFAQGSAQFRPTGIAADAAGRVFVTGLYLGGNVVTPHCPSDLVVLAPAGGLVPLRDETRATTEALWAALDGPSWETRRRVHTELLRRGGDALAPAVDRLRRARDGDPSAVHLPWLAAAAGGEAAAVLTEIAADREKPVLRLQSLRALATFPALAPPGRVFAHALGDPSEPIRLAGLEGLFALGGRTPPASVAKLAGGPDPTLRQAASTLLARTASVEDLERLAHSEEASARLAGVLATGIRLTVPPADAAPPRGVALHSPKGSAFFSPVLRFADGPESVDLASLGPVGSYTTAQRWAAATHTPDEERLFRLLTAALGDRDDGVKSQAVYYLGWLRDARSEPAVARIRRELRTRGLADRPAVPVPKAWRIGRFADPAAGQTLERGPIDLTATVAAGGDKRTWEVATAGGGRLPLPAGPGMAYVYFRVQSRDRQPALLSVRSAGARVWHNGRAVEVEPDGAALLDLQPGSNEVLLRTTATELRELMVRARAAVSVGLPERADGATLTERLKAAKGAAAVSPQFLAFDWSAEGRKGDASRGRKLFGSLGCVKCHAITADQAGGGAPSLTDAGKRFTPAHLAESILLPDRQVADEFRASRVVLIDGRVLTGLVVRESAGVVELLLSDTTRRALKAADVESREALPTSPMPGGLVKTPDELRDLLTYLLSDQPQPP